MALEQNLDIKSIVFFIKINLFHRVVQMLCDDLLCLRVVYMPIALAVTIDRAFFAFIVMLYAAAAWADKVILISVFLRADFLLLLFDVSETSFLYLFHELVVVVCMI